MPNFSFEIWQNLLFILNYNTEMIFYSSMNLMLLLTIFAVWPKTQIMMMTTFKASTIFFLSVLMIFSCLFISYLSGIYPNLPAPSTIVLPMSGPIPLLNIQHQKN